MGHGTDRAVLLGLMGEAPDTVDPASVDAKIAEVRETRRLQLGGRVEIAFRRSGRSAVSARADVSRSRGGVASEWDAVYGVRGANGVKLAEEVFYSVGGGFIVSEAERW